MSGTNSLLNYGPFRAKMDAAWRLDEALMGGTHALREAGTEYLPRFAGETSANYERRKSMASLTNFYVKAVNTMVGEIFRDDPRIDESGIPEKLLDDIDLRGRRVGQFAERCAEHLLRTSVALVIVDFPTSEDVTLRDVQTRNLRHYWTLIDPRDVIDVRTVFIDGVETIIHCRWIERTIEPSTDNETEFDFDPVRDVLVMDRQPIYGESGAIVAWDSPRGRKYRIRDNETTGEALTAWFPLGYDAIPAVAMQVNRRGFFYGRPPLSDIAEKNLQHWRQAANFANSLEIGSFPVLVRYMNNASPLTPDDNLPGGRDLDRDDSGNIILGPHTIIDMPSRDAGADIEYVEVTGASYSAMERYLDRIINEAELMALDLLIKVGPERSATEATYDRLQQMAPLQRVAYEIERGITELLAVTSTVRGLGELPGRFVINKDFGVSASEAARVMALKDAFTLGALSRVTYIAELQKLGALSATINPEQEAADAQANDDLQMDAISS